MPGFSGPEFFGVTHNNVGGKISDFFALLIFNIKDFFAGPGGVLLQFILILIAVAAAFCVVYFYIKTEEIEKSEHRKIRKVVEERKAVIQKSSPQLGWEKVTSYLERGNESEWRLAILEADTILDNLLDELRYTGESVGDKLKLVDASKMRNLDAAWEAHKIRNRIAHDGSNYPITYREARRVLALYEQVLREFGYV